MNILSFRPNMARGAALIKLAPSGARGVVHRWLTGTLVGIADVHIPYRLYEVTVKDRRFQSHSYYATDAAAGVLDPYIFAAAPGSNDFVQVETRNCHPVLLDERRTNQLATEAARRSAFLRGFFRVTNPSISATLIKAEFHIPYWVGFYSTASHSMSSGTRVEQPVSLAVVNAVRGVYEGSKVRKLIQAWLMDREQKVAGAALAPHQL